jgi:hypothetical protein
VTLEIYLGFITVKEPKRPNRSNMTLRQAPTKHAAVIIFVLVSAIAGSGLLFLSAWMGSVAPSGLMMMEYLAVKHVQFSEDLMTVTAKNYGRGPINIGEVKVSETPEPFTIEGYLTLPFDTVPVEEQIEAGEQSSITISYEWTPGTFYQVVLVSLKGNPFGYNAVAPAPLENPFNHPFWHKQSFVYEYW